MCSAEREGFEPSDEVDPRHTISRRAPGPRSPAVYAARLERTPCKSATSAVIASSVSAGVVLAFVRGLPLPSAALGAALRVAAVGRVEPRAALRAANVVVQQVRVSARRDRDGTVAEAAADGGQVPAVREQRRGVRVAQAARRNDRHPGPPARGGESSPDAAVAERAAGGRGEHGRGVGHVRALQLAPAPAPSPGHERDGQGQRGARPTLRTARARPHPSRAATPRADRAPSQGRPVHRRMERLARPDRVDLLQARTADAGAKPSKPWRFATRSAAYERRTRAAAAVVGRLHDCLPVEADIPPAPVRHLA